jgi:hypothetical protein
MASTGPSADAPLLSSSAEPHASSLNHLFDDIQQMSMSSKRSNESNTAEQIAQYFCGQGLLTYEKNMREKSCSLEVDYTGIPTFGPEQMQLAVRPPSDRQYIVISPDHDFFVGVYTRGQVDQLTKRNFSELPGVFIMENEITDSIIEGLASRVATQASMADSEQTTTIQIVIPDTWWSSWNIKGRLNKDLIQFWEIGSEVIVQSIKYVLPALGSNKKLYVGLDTPPSRKHHKQFYNVKQAYDYVKDLVARNGIETLELKFVMNIARSGVSVV